MTRGQNTSHGSSPRARRLVSLAAVCAGAAALALALLADARVGESPDAPAAPAAGFVSAAAEPALQGPDYSRFAHSNPEHARLPCLLCHRREDSATKPRRTGHMPCAGCHTQQFADPQSPICAICHTDPPSAALRPFPPLRSFNARFDHALHARGAARPRNNCAACHRPARRGVALSLPSGASAHATCYQCHGARPTSPGARDLSSCNLCHELGRLTRVSESAAAFRVGFSHAEHARKGLGCGECHTVRAGAPRGRQVSSPQPLMHHASPRAQSCMSCHDNRRAFGGDNFADCKKCHEGNTWHF